MKRKKRTKINCWTVTLFLVQLDVQAFLRTMALVLPVAGVAGRPRKRIENKFTFF